MVRSGFHEYEVKKLRSPACSREEIAIFPPHIHGTQSAPLSAPQYEYQMNDLSGKCLQHWMNTFVIQTLGGKDAVFEAGTVVVSLLNVHVVVTFVVGYSKNMFDS